MKQFRFQFEILLQHAELERKKLLRDVQKSQFELQRLANELDASDQHLKLCTAAVDKRLRNLDQAKAKLFDSSANWLPEVRMRELDLRAAEVSLTKAQIARDSNNSAVETQRRALEKLQAQLKEKALEQSRLESVRDQWKEEFLKDRETAEIAQIAELGAIQVFAAKASEEPTNDPR